MEVFYDFYLICYIKANFIFHITNFINFFLRWVTMGSELNSPICIFNAFKMCKIHQQPQPILDQPHFVYHLINQNSHKC